MTNHLGVLINVGPQGRDVLERNPLFLEVLRPLQEVLHNGGLAHKVTSSQRMPRRAALASVVLIPRILSVLRFEDFALVRQLRG